MGRRIFFEEGAWEGLEGRRGGAGVGGGGREEEEEDEDGTTRRTGEREVIICWLRQPRRPWLVGVLATLGGGPADGAPFETMRVPPEPPWLVRWLVGAPRLVGWLAGWLAYRPMS